MKRVMLFVLTNIAVLVLLGAIFQLLGVERFLYQQGIRFNLPTLLIFASVLGFGGAFISLMMSKWSAIHLMGAQVISQPSNAHEQWLVSTVQRQAQSAGIPMPDVAIFDSADVNAFATGASKQNSLVAVSTGLLQQMNQAEIEGVLGHEITHIANGDMVTMTLIQGVVNTFVIVFARLVGLVLDRAMRGGRDSQYSYGPGPGYFIGSMIAQVIFGFFATMIVMWFSRQREFHADAGSAHIAGRQKMISALQRLQSIHEPAQLPQQLAAFGIHNGLSGLFRSHPPLADRITALQQLQV